MKSFLTAAAIAGFAGLTKAAVPGFDISGWQESTDFAKAYADGDRFVIIKVYPSDLARKAPPLTLDPRPLKAQHTRVNVSVLSTMAPQLPD
jgi:hypothetical protein